MESLAVCLSESRMMLDSPFKKQSGAVIFAVIFAATVLLFLQLF